MFKRICTAWWVVPLLSIGILLLHTLSLTGAGGPRVTATGVVAGVLLVPLWLVLVLACRKRWQVARMWRHWVAGSAAEALQLAWCVFAALLYSSVVVDSLSPCADSPGAADLPAPLPCGTAVAAAPPAVCVEQGERAGTYRVHAILPDSVSAEGVFLVRALGHASGKPVETSPMIRRVSDADRRAARGGVMDITFPDVAVYGNRRLDTLWRLVFLPDSGGEEEIVCETPCRIGGS